MNGPWAAAGRSSQGRPQPCAYARGESDGLRITMEALFIPVHGHPGPGVSKNIKKGAASVDMVLDVCSVRVCSPTAPVQTHGSCDELVRLTNLHARESIQRITCTRRRPHHHFGDVEIASGLCRVPLGARRKEEGENGGTFSGTSLNREFVK